MKKILLATTAVAAFVAFSGVAQAQDPGRPDFGATEGGGKAGSAFTVTVGGDISFFLKYATADDSLETVVGGEAELGNDGLFALISGELHINGAATTDNGTDIETHLELEYSGIGGDATRNNTAGSGSDPIPVGDIVRVDELSMKIGGGWGSVELGANDGAEDTFKIYGGSIAAGTGGTDGFAHGVTGGVNGWLTTGGTAGSGDSSDALKATYLSPVVAGFQGGVSVNYQTEGPNDPDGGTLGVGLGVKYAGSASGLDYAVSIVWGDTSIAGQTSAAGLALVAADAGGDAAAQRVAARPAADADRGGLGIGVKLGGAGVQGVVGVTIDGLGRSDVAYASPDPDIDLGMAVAYAIPGGKANVSLSSVLRLPYSETESTNELSEYLVFASADYAVLPGVTLALDLGYGDSDIADESTVSGGFTGVFRAKASF